MWRTNNDPRANVPTGGRVAWSQLLAGRPTMAEGERPHRGFSDRRGVRLEDAADDNASGKQSSSFHSPEGRLADARLRISEDMELACLQCERPLKGTLGT
jgi:hypothetical protein